MMNNNCNNEEEVSECKVEMNECDGHDHDHHHHNHEYCPFKSTILKLDEAFCDAIHEIYVDMLKERIHKTWGNQIEKAAEAVFSAKNAEWMADLSKSKAQHELKDQIKKILSEGKK